MLLDVSQQAASKSIAELVALGYVEDEPQVDRRTRRVTLSERGLACIEAARASARRQEAQLALFHGASESAARGRFSPRFSKEARRRASRSRRARSARRAERRTHGDESWAERPALPGYEACLGRGRATWQWLT